MRYYIDSDFEIGGKAMLEVVFRVLERAEFRVSGEDGLPEFENCQPYRHAPEILADGAQDEHGDWWIKIWARDLDEATFRHRYAVSVENLASPS